MPDTWARGSVGAGEGRTGEIGERKREDNGGPEIGGREEGDCTGPPRGESGDEIVCMRHSSSLDQFPWQVP